MSSPNPVRNSMFVEMVQPCEVLAESLVARGIATVQYEKRGIGGSEGTYDPMAVVQESADLVAVICSLQGRPEVDRGRIGLCGHCEGGMVAARVARERSEIRWLVTLAAPAEPPDSLLVGILRASAGSMPHSSQWSMDEAGSIGRAVARAIHTGHGWDDVRRLDLAFWHRIHT